ncbi:MAG: GntR family transcriptional regulator [Oscillospiraceae bacterium]|nr:GntR family transcriptional regulator [Oscillospiraceae bacterium]
MIQLDYRDARPIYVQIKDGVKRMIATGALAPGERLPGIRELAANLSINPNTIARAYKELEQEGYIYSVGGKGSFVSQETTAADAQKEQAMQRFDSAARELLSLGVDVEELIRRLEK